MFDTMTMTKAVGGFCGAFLIYLLGGWAGESLYSVGGHGGEEVASYVIEVEEGKKVAWCACGRSANQPFCDGSHSRENTGITPIVFTVEKIFGIR